MRKLMKTNIGGGSMRGRHIVLHIGLVGVVVGWSLAAVPALTAQKGLYPDLQTVVPKHLSIQNVQQREILRVTNGIANRGVGPWQLRPEFQSDVTIARQEILDANGQIVNNPIVGRYVFHPVHNHWHIENVALLEVRKARDNGTGGRWGGAVVNDLGQVQTIKTTFCLIDWYKLDDNAPTGDRTYWDCERDLQGISVGWVDQYHHSLEGQQIDITGAPVGIYYLVSTANPDGNFLEQDLTNNTAWVSFRLTRDSKGNPKITEITHSPCETPGMCGEQATNR